MKAMGWMLGCWMLAGVALGETLSLENYLGQVKSQGPAFRSAQAAAEGYEKQSHQQDLIYSPTLNLFYNRKDDRQQQPSLFSPDGTLVDSAGVSLSTLMPFGLTLRLGYSLDNIRLNYSPGLLASFPPGSFLTSYYQISPVASLSLPLFKDLGGAQTNAGVHKVQYQLESAAKGAAFQKEQALFTAKVAYWNLALTRAETGIRQDTLNRSQKIWEWTKRRVARNLADPPDALQAEASVRVAELDLQMAGERERTARLQFNRYRNLDKDDVSEQLEGLEDSLLGLNVAIPEIPPVRLDLKATEASTKQQKASYDEAKQNVFPDITLNASWRGNGLDPNFNPANSVAFGFDHPTYNIGAQFNLPLDVFTASRAAEGYKLNYESSILTLADKELEVTQQWRDLRDRLLDVTRRLEMAAQIEVIQKRKADEEKRRLELGRTTQFQLLSFENDYALARLNRLSLVLEKLSLLAQAQWWLAGESSVKEGASK